MAALRRFCFSSGTNVIRVGSRKFKAKLGSLSVAQIFKREHSWEWIERERDKLRLNDTCKKVKWEVASEKKGAAGSSLSSNRRNCIIGGRRHMCSKRGQTPVQHLLCTRHCAGASRSLLHRIISEGPYKTNHITLIFHLKKLRLGDKMNCPRSPTSQIPTLAFLRFPLCRFPVQRKHIV